MNDIEFTSLTIFGALLAFLILKYSVQKIGLIQYPFLVSATLAGWVLPQLIGIYINQTVPEGALTRTIIYTTICLICSIWGYSVAKRPFKIASWEFSSRRLDICAFVLMAFGLYFYVRVASMAAVATELYGGFWTGEITIYVFLASSFKYGFIIAAASNVQRPSWINRILLIAGLLTILNAVIFQGRRQEAVELFVIVLWYVWLKRAWLPPRSVVIGALLIGTLFVNTVATYRNIVVRTTGDAEATTTLRDLSQINFVDLFLSNVQNSDSNYELTNASFNIAATDSRMTFDGGLSLWNMAVLNFVPGQIVGFQVKQAMMFELEDVAWTEFKHEPFPGTTSTGMADTFRSFWYFGAAVFFLIGVIMKRFFIGGSRKSLLSVVALMFFTGQSLLAYTHMTGVFFCSFVNFAVFIFPALRYARISDGGR